MYVFGGDNNSLKHCNKTSIASNVDAFDVYSRWLAVWMRPYVSTLGCVYSDCPSQEASHLFFCEFLEIPRTFYGAMFRNRHFFNLCQSEAGRWRSCDKELERNCVRRGKIISGANVSGQGSDVNSGQSVTPTVPLALLLALLETISS